MSKLNCNACCRRMLMLVGLWLILPTVAVGHISKLWSFEEMFQKADLVLIGKVLSSADTNDRDVISGNIDIKVIGVITKFTPRLILKGSKGIQIINLYHYRFENPNDVSITNGPELVRVGRPDSSYLLFLVRERTGNYAPVTGQSDPIDSVIPLLSSAE